MSYFSIYILFVYVDEKYGEAMVETYCIILLYFTIIYRIEGVGKVGNMLCLV